MRNPRAQSATEFLIQYSWAVIIMIVALSAVVLIATAQHQVTVTPSYCYISPELNCYQTIVGVNSIGSTITTYFTNTQTKSIVLTGYTIAPTSTSSYYQGICNVTTLAPGQSAQCTSNIQGFTPPAGSQLNPVFYIQYQLCSTSCAAGPAVNTAGTAVVSTPSIHPFTASTTLGSSSTTLVSSIVSSSTSSSSTLSSSTLSSSTLSSSTLSSTTTVIPLTVVVSPTSASVDSGQSQTLTATPSGGSGSYSYQWYSNAGCTTSIGGATSSTYGASASTTYCVKVTDSLSSTASATATLTVNGALSASVSPSSSNIDSGQSQTLTATPSGGSGSYSYQWYSNAGCTTSIGGATSSTYGASASTTYCVKVTDSLSSTASATATLTVNGALSASVSPSSSNIDSGQTKTLTATPSGGSGSYSYQWYSNPSCTTSIGGATSSTYGASVSGTYCVKVTDSLSSTASATATLTVNGAFSASVSPSSSNIDSGQTQTLTASVSGGSGGYTYQWYSNSGCTTSISGATSSTYVASSSATYCVRVTDSLSSSLTATSVVTVNSPLSVLVSPSSSNIDSGQNQPLYASQSGGAPGYTFQWYSNAGCTTPISGATSPPYVASSAGTYCVKVTDSLSSTATGTAVVNVNPVLTASISPSSGAIDTGQQSLTFTASASGGSGFYIFNWYSNSGCLSQVGGGPMYMTSSAGTYCLIATDNLGSSASSTATLTVYPTLSVSISPSSSGTTDIGHSYQFTAVPSGGSNSYTYQWYQGGCGGAPLATSQSYAASQPGSYCVTVTDTTSSTATASATLSVNNPPSVSVSPTSGTIEGGQTKTFTANPSQGTTPYSYLWYYGPSCTGSVLATSQSYAASAQGSYCLLLTDAAGATASATAMLMVFPALTVMVNPPMQAIPNGNTPSPISSNPQGGSPPFSYKWYKNSCGGGVVSTSQTYAPGPLSVTTDYCVVVTDSISGTASASSVVTVMGSPPASSTTLISTTLFSTTTIAVSSTTVSSSSSSTLSSSTLSSSSSTLSSSTLSSSTLSSSTLSSSSSTLSSSTFSSTTTTIQYYTVTLQISPSAADADYFACFTTSSTSQVCTSTGSTSSVSASVAAGSTITSACYSGPGGNYQFTGWTGAFSSGTACLNPGTTVNGPLTLQANYACKATSAFLFDVPSWSGNIYGSGSTGNNQGSSVSPNLASYGTVSSIAITSTAYGNDNTYSGSVVYATAYSGVGGSSVSDSECAFTSGTQTCTSTLATPTCTNVHTSSASCTANAGSTYYPGSSGSPQVQAGGGGENSVGGTYYAIIYYTPNTC